MFLNKHMLKKKIKIKNPNMIFWLPLLLSKSVCLIIIFFKEKGRPPLRGKKEEKSSRPAWRSELGLLLV